MNKIFPALLFLTLFVGCSRHEESVITETPIVADDGVISEDFECGSIGEVNRVSDTEWELSLADDNDNPELPQKWRNWWYVKMEKLDKDSLTQITLKYRGWPYFYLPLYSYNQTDWIHFSEDEVSKNANNELIIKKTFEHETVWLSRFFPYTFTDLENYIETISSKTHITIETPGFTQGGKPLYLFKITDSSVPDTGKERIFIHGRTHPAEIPSSFLIEGMVDYLLGGTDEAGEILKKFEFYIFPMQNVDGVIAGNYRSTPQTENLEVMWNYDSENPLNLNASTPPEITTIHQYAKNLMSDGGPKISIALNLHASNSEADVRTFFYPHFGDEAQGYTSSEASLWNKQISFISHLSTHFGANMIEPVPNEGGNSFASKTYPESWWWVNFRDEVMAMTMEMTYGRSGSSRWIEPDDFRKLGQHLTLAISDYSSTPADQFQTDLIRGAQAGYLRYPELYPPHAEDESKE